MTKLGLPFDAIGMANDAVRLLQRRLRISLLQLGDECNTTEIRNKMEDNYIASPTMSDLADLFTRAAQNQDELRWLRKQYAELEQKYNELLDSSVKQAQETSGLLLASVVAGMKLDKGPV